MVKEMTGSQRLEQKVKVEPSTRWPEEVVTLVRKRASLEEPHEHGLLLANSEAPRALGQTQVPRGEPLTRRRGVPFAGPASRCVRTWGHPHARPLDWGGSNFWGFSWPTRGGGHRRDDQLKAERIRGWWVATASWASSDLLGGPPGSLGAGFRRPRLAASPVPAWGRPSRPGLGAVEAGWVGKWLGDRGRGWVWGNPASRTTFLRAGEGLMASLRWAPLDPPFWRRECRCVRCPWIAAGGFGVSGGRCGYWPPSQPASQSTWGPRGPGSAAESEMGAQLGGLSWAMALPFLHPTHLSPKGPLSDCYDFISDLQPPQWTAPNWDGPTPGSAG